MLAEVNEKTASPAPAHDGITAVAFDTVVGEIDKDRRVRFAPRQPDPPPRVDGHLLALTSVERRRAPHPRTR
jgi:hypothetical protein